jgi:flavin reductase (DIM6/NTAB) family NADH-FMN oxidoreductase RutF
VSDDGTAFGRIASTTASPMVIATTRAGDDADGCLVGFATQCSIDPVRFLVCLSNANRTYDIARHASTVVVHVLHDAPHDRRLARIFGEETSFEADKLAECAWDAGPDGVPVLRGLDWFAGRILDQVDLGDHSGFVLAVGSDGRAARVHEPPLTFVDVRMLDAGNPA